jgi:DNA-binding MurR/RpiR family transcriptional regulator
MRNVIHIINNRYSELKPAEKAVAEYVVKKPEEVILLSMKALAEKVDVSDNSVLRFCRTCGFSGYLDFKTALLPQIITQKGSIYKQVGMGDDFLLRKTKIMDNIVSTVKETYEAVPEDDISLAAEKIAAGSGTVTVGLAASAGVALVFSDSLLSMGIPSVSISDRIEIERYCSCLNASSVLVGFSTSGETREVLMAIERAKENNAFTILISNNLAVKNEVQADIFLFTQIPSRDIAGSFFALPRIAQLSLVELILSKIPGYIQSARKK